MSPEQVKGEEVDHRTDIFSCGVLLYELLTGKKAFHADTVAAVFYQIVHLEPPPICEQNPGVPAYLADIAGKALAKDRNLRYQSAKAMREDILGCRSPVRQGTTLSMAGDGKSEPTVVLGQGERTVLLSKTYPAPQGHGAGERFLWKTMPGGPRKRRGALLKVLVPVVALLLLGGAASAFLVLQAAKTKVPDVVGLELAKARREVEGAGLTLKVVGDSAGSQQGDLEVVSQSPAPGQRLRKGSAVEVELGPRREVSAVGTSTAGQPTSPQASGATQAATEPPPTYLESGSGVFYRLAMSNHNDPEHAYSINFPSGWILEESRPSYGHRAKWKSPDGSMYFLVDTGGKGTDVCQTARALDGSFRSKPGYTCHCLERTSFKGHPACRWEFTMVSEEDSFYRGYKIKKLDFFVDGSRFGYAVLFAARPEAYDRNITSFVDVVLASFTCL